MSVQFVLGPSGSGKSTMILQNIIRESVSHPDSMFFLIVPEQYTMEAQRELVTMHPKGGTMNIDAIGFNRLAYRIFDELGISTGQVLFDFGKSMLIKKILWDNRKRLQVYQGCIDKMGFVDEMKSMMSELFQYGIHKTDIISVMEELDKDSTTYRKLSDLQLIFEEFETFMGKSYVVAEQLTELLTDCAAKSAVLKNSYLYLDGFTGFTPVQMKLLGELMKYTKGMTFAFTLGAKERSFQNIREHELFYLTKTTVKALAEMAAEEHTELEEPVFLDGGIPYRFQKNPELAWLERNLFRYPYKSYHKSLHNIKITAADNRREELFHVAEQIRMLVRKKGYRYREIAIIAGDLEESSHDFKRIMEEFHIPVFIDANTMLKGNPCSETLRSLVAMFSDDFSYDSVFRFLKAGMTDIDLTQIEYLENYVLKKNLRGYRAWNREIAEIYDDCPAHSIEAARKSFMQLIVDISNVFRDRTSTVRDYVTALYQFMLDIQMYEKLKQKQQALYDSQLFDEGHAYGQIYSGIVSLFDKIIELLGNEHMDAKEFYEVMDTGLADLEIGTVPPTIDRVLIGDITRSRLNHIKVLFLTGVNDGIIPKRVKKGKIFSDYDREALAEAGMELAPSDKRNAYIEQFYLYSNITKPSDLLFLSYRRANGDQENSRPSYLLNRIQNIFPALTVQEYISGQQFETAQGILRYLARNHAQEKERECWNTLAVLLREQGYDREICALTKGLGYTNQVRPLDQRMVRLLYGKELIQSVSRLETFAKCRYAYFLRYGLGLLEREMYHVDVRDIGTILHQVMEDVFIRVRDTRHNDWKELPENDRDDMVAEAVRRAAGDNTGTFFEDFARNRYMYQMVERMAKRSVKTLHRHLKLGTMQPGLIEKNFDTRLDSVERYQFELDTGMKMYLRGKIDRVDVEEEDGIVYIKVLDYKSSSKDLKANQILSGLQLQLLTYSAVAYELEKQMYPDKEIRMAGLFYYGFDDPIIEVPDILFTDKTDGADNAYVEEIEEKRLEHLKMKGFVHQDTEIMRKIDKTMMTALPVKLDKTGNPKPSDHILSDEDFRELMEITEENIRELGNQIANGRIDIWPVRDGKNMACEYCGFHAVCRFDTQYGDNSFRQMKKRMEKGE